MATASASSGTSTGPASSQSCWESGRSSCWRPPRGSATSPWGRWNGCCAGLSTDDGRVSCACRLPSPRSDAPILGLDARRGRGSVVARLRLELDHDRKRQYLSDGEHVPECIL